MLPVDVVFSLVFIVEWLGLINFDLYIENRFKMGSIRRSIGNFWAPISEQAYEMDNRLIFQLNFNGLCVCACYLEELFGS